MKNMLIAQYTRDRYVTYDVTCYLKDKATPLFLALGVIALIQVAII